MNTEPLPSACLDQLRALSSCVVASAIETFAVRLRNKGFTDSRLHCIFDELPPTVGYAATARIRTSDPPMEGHSFYDHRDWWDSLLTIPAPRVVVIQDMDKDPGLGAFIGEVHANILRALGGVGLVTNGAVRDLPQVNRIGFQMFAGNVSLSHAYSHVFDFGGTVEIAGLAVRPGDLIHGDLHGVQTVPLEIAKDVPARALEIIEHRQDLISFCQSDRFSLPNLRRKIQELKS
ncbi:MAG: RraA family protein [Candidatus Acidiferrales bacterium]